MEGRSTIESHSSFINNKIIGMARVEVNRLALIAANTLYIKNLQAYYNAVEQMYIDVASVLPDESVKEIEDLRKKYNFLIELVEKEETLQSLKALRLILKYTKKIHFTLINGLQERDYWFRIASKPTKGLKNISFFEKSIFGSGGKNGAEKQAEART